MVQGNDIGEDRVMTFSDVRDEVCRVVRLPSDVRHVMTQSLCQSLLVHCHSQGMPCAVYRAASALQANWLKSVGIGKGDAVAIYMPMVCELPSKGPPTTT